MNNEYEYINVPQQVKNEGKSNEKTNHDSNSNNDDFGREQQNTGRCIHR